MELNEALDFIDHCMTTGDEFWFDDKRYKFGKPLYFHRGVLFVKSGSTWESAKVPITRLIREREKLERINI